MDFYNFWLTKITYQDLMVEMNNLNTLLEITEKESVKIIVNKKLASVVKRIEKIERVEKIEYELLGS
jgi:hypothetical protein